jgi:chemotaxis family two-component system response regulator Rcp1
MATKQALPLLLLAEDDRDSAFLFERIFKQVCPCWSFVCMPDGLAAVHYMEENGLPQVLVTDLNMPRMDGYGLISWVRSRREALRIPVVVTTSGLDEEIQQKCHDLGADEALVKGSRIEDLKNVLRRFTAFAEKEQSLRANGHDGNGA